MRDPDNIQDLVALGPDFIGFIFFEKSKRYVSHPETLNVASIPSHVKKVGVFVNASFELISELVEKYHLDFVQLHGTESPELCQRLKDTGVGVIKVFSVGDTFDFDQLNPYKPYSDYFLFDTKGKEYGGNGVTFDWNTLSAYDNEIPFFISGGLSLDNIDQISGLKGMNLAAVDLNSCFETEPGLKNIDMLRSLNFDQLRHKLAN